MLEVLLCLLEVARVCELRSQMDARSKMGLVMKQYLLKMVYRLLIYFLALILASEVEVRL